MIARESERKKKKKNGMDWRIRDGGARQDRGPTIETGRVQNCGSDLIKEIL